MIILSVLFNSKTCTCTNKSAEHNNHGISSNQEQTIENNVKTKIKKKKKKYIKKGVPNNNSFKSYMDAKCITDKTSPQYKLKSKYQLASNGIYMVNGRYCIAVGSYYTTKIGTKIDLIMENGSTVKCILADQKADKDTDSATHRQNENGSIVEFIVNTNSLSSLTKKMGDISYSKTELEGEVKQIKIYKK